MRKKNEKGLRRLIISTLAGFNKLESPKHACYGFRTRDLQLLSGSVSTQCNSYAVGRTRQPRLRNLITESDYGIVAISHRRVRFFGAAGAEKADL